MAKDDARAEDDLSLPRSTIDKLLAHSGLSVPRSVREHVVPCLHHFIRHIALKANALCEREKKKTITHEHVYVALESAGFGHYIADCRRVYEETLCLSRMRPSRNNKLKNSKLSMDELRMEQNRLFESARKEFENMETSCGRESGDEQMSDRMSEHMSGNDEK